MSDGVITVRATLRLRNDAMIAAREVLSLSQKQVAELAGVGQEAVGRFERFDFTSGSEELVVMAERIATVLEIELSQVLPEDLIGQKLQSQITKTFTARAAALLSAANESRYILPSPDEVLERSDAQTAIDLFKKTSLTFREREILKLRFGLDGSPPYTLDEVGRMVRSTKERVRQIQNRGLNKMRLKAMEVAA